MERRREVIFSLWLLVVPLWLLIIGELGARQYFNRTTAGDFSWSDLRQSIARPEDGIPYRLQPNTHYREVHINSLGLRGPEIAVPKPGGTVRLALIGDSTIFNAALPEDQTFGAQLVAQLGTAYPECLFDYANFSGPAYNLAFLAQHWPEQRDQIDADVAVILAGSPYEALSSRTMSGGQPKTGWFSTANIRLLRMAKNVLRRVSVTRAFSPAPEDAPEFAPGVTEKLAQMQDNLAQLGSANSVVLIGHRGRIRPDMPAETLAEATQHMRNSTGIKHPETALAVTQQTVSAMQAVADAQGWLFVDALQDVPIDQQHFHDDLHLSGPGISALTQSVLPTLKSALSGCNGTPGG